MRLLCPSLVCVSSLLWVVSSACFITNCPPGGKKRSLWSPHHFKQCTACGPDSQSRCFGLDLCCGPDGCYKGTPEAAICRRENLSTVPCKNQAAKCTAVSRGQCVTNGYCCNEMGDCMNDRSCAQPGSSPPNAARFDVLPVNDDLRAYELQKEEYKATPSRWTLSSPEQRQDLGADRDVSESSLQELLASLADQLPQK